VNPTLLNQNRAGMPTQTAAVPSLAAPQQPVHSVVDPSLLQAEIERATQLVAQQLLQQLGLQLPANGLTPELIALLQQQPALQDISLAGLQAPNTFAAPVTMAPTPQSYLTSDVSSSGLPPLLSAPPAPSLVQPPRRSGKHRRETPPRPSPPREVIDPWSAEALRRCVFKVLIKDLKEGVGEMIKQYMLCMVVFSYNVKLVHCE